MNSIPLSLKSTQNSGLASLVHACTVIQQHSSTIPIDWASKQEAMLLINSISLPTKEKKRERRRGRSTDGHLQRWPPSRLYQWMATVEGVSGGGLWKGWWLPGRWQQQGTESGFSVVPCMCWIGMPSRAIMLHLPGPRCCSLFVSSSTHSVWTHVKYHLNIVYFEEERIFGSRTPRSSKFSKNLKLTL